MRTSDATDDGDDKGWLAPLPGVTLLVALYGLAHAAMRLLTSQNLGENDPQIALSIQDGLRWSYGVGEPPLFEWLAWALAEIFGPTALIFQILRYGCLALTLILVFLIARRMMGSSLWALVTVESYALVYQISWRLHEGFTHPMIAMTAVVGLFYALMRLMDRVNAPNAMLFCTFLAIGLVSNAWFYAFMPAFVAAALSVKPARRALLHPATLAAAGLAVCSAIPFWRAGPLFFNAPGWQMVTAPGTVLSVAFGARLDGFVAGLVKPLLFLSPLLPILALWFAKPLWRGRWKVWRSTSTAEQLLVRTLVAAVAALILYGVVTGQGDYPEHAVMPLFVLGPIVLVRWVQRSAPSASLVKRFVSLCLVLMVVAFGARAANFIILDPVCNRCYFGIPFNGLAEAIADAYPRHVVFADHRRLGGNLRAFLPEDTTVRALGWPQAKPLDHGADAVLIVTRREDIEALTAASAGLGFVRDGEVRAIAVPWPHLFRETGYRSTVWYAVPGRVASPP